jgi:hypothetical protein
METMGHIFKPSRLFTGFGTKSFRLILKLTSRWNCWKMFLIYYSASAYTKCKEKRSWIIDVPNFLTNFWNLENMVFVLFFLKLCVLMQNSLRIFREKYHWSSTISLELIRNCLLLKNYTRSWTISSSLD